MKEIKVTIGKDLKIDTNVQKEIDMFDDISYEDGNWRDSDDMRFPKTLSKHLEVDKHLEKQKATDIDNVKTQNIIEALNIEGNTDFKNNIAKHITLKKEKGRSIFKTKTIIAHELSENPDEFEEIAKEIITSYNDQHTLKVFGEEE